MTIVSYLAPTGVGSFVKPRGGSRKSLRVVLLVAKPTCREIRGGLPCKWRFVGGLGACPQKIFGNTDDLRCNLAHS